MWWNLAIGAWMMSLFIGVSCARQEGVPRISDRVNAGIQGPVMEMSQFDYEAVDSENGLVAAYEDPLVNTVCLFNEQGVLLEQYVRMAPRSGGDPEFMILSILDDQGRVMEQEGGDPGQEGYFKHFNTYEQGRLVRQVRLPEGVDLAYSYEENGRKTTVVGRDMETGELVWTKTLTFNQDGYLLSELLVDSNGNKVSDLNQSYRLEDALEKRVVGYWDGGDWIEEETTWIYDEQGRPIQEETGYVGTGFSVVTTYSDFDEFGNWRRSEVRDHSGLPFRVSFRRFTYYPG